MNEKTIAEGALAKATPDEQTAYLEAACGEDLALRRRVEALMHTHEAPADAPDVTAAFTSSTDVSEVLPAPPGDAAPAETRAELPAERPDEELPFLQPSTRPDSLGRLAHYEVLQVLGKGGFGIVLKAFDEKLHRMVAIKILGSQLSGSTTARKRFVREARAAAAVRDEHVVKVFDVEENPVPYLVMEYVAGETLQDRVDRDGPLAVAAVLSIGAQIARGLAAAHGKGEVHRDIKPANILLEHGTDRARITDFGLARAVDDASLTQSGVIAGTPMYMSPEQARGESVDHRSDLFSLGSVLYTLATGRPPFRAAKTLGVLKRVCDDAPDPIREINPQVPAGLVKIIERLLAKEREARFQRAAEVAELLEQLLAHVKDPANVSSPVIAEVEPEKAPEPLSPRRKKRPAKWSRGRWVAVVVGLSVIPAGIVALVGGFLLWLLLDRAPDEGRPGTPLPPQVTETQRLWAQAQMAFQQGNLEQAATACREIIKLEPNHFNARLGLGAVLLEQKKWDEAIAAYEQAAEVDPRDFRPPAMRGVVLVRQQKLDEAAAAFREAIALSPGNPQLAGMLAETSLVLLKQKKWSEAEPLLRECLAIRERIQPDEWQTFNTRSMLGGALLGQKKYAEAEPLLLAGYQGMKRQEDMIPPQGRPRLIEAVERLVQLFEATGKKDEAAKWRKELEAVKGAEQTGAASSPEVRAAVKRGQWREVKALLAQSLQTNPENSDTWCEAATLAAYLEDAEEYARCRTEMLKRFGETRDPQVAERVAKSCLLLPGDAEARTSAEKLAQFAVASGEKGHWILPYAQFARGMAEYRGGNFEAAETSVSKAITPQTRHWTMTVPSYLVLAMCQHQRGQGNEAQFSLARAVAILDQEAPTPASPAVDENVKGWLICQVLRREAEALIKGKKEAPKQ